MIGVPWILVVILGLIFILATVVFTFYKYRKEGYKPNYYNIFMLGIVFFVLGLIIKITVFWILGIVYMVIGGAHRNQWKKNRKTWKKMSKNKRKIFIGVVIALLFFLLGIGIFLFMNNENEITNFEECAAAGNPIMESYPRQCRANGKTFVEEIKGNSPLTGSIVNE